MSAISAYGEPCRWSRTACRNLAAMTVYNINQNVRLSTEAVRPVGSRGMTDSGPETTRMEFLIGGHEDIVSSARVQSGRVADHHRVV